MARTIIKNGRNERLEFRCSTEEKKKIEELAKYLEMPSSTLVRNLVIASYEDAIIFKRIGILKGAKKIKDFKEKLSSLFDEH
ncbi:MAG TPA: hypothetical protein ENK91_13695, partial [Bacteroidetes bacterium]|nr:hypothetical protein [Bacteroidota bacterium]